MTEKDIIRHPKVDALGIPEEFVDLLGYKWTVLEGRMKSMVDPGKYFRWVLRHDEKGDVVQQYPLSEEFIRRAMKEVAERDRKSRRH